MFATPDLTAGVVLFNNTRPHTLSLASGVRKLLFLQPT
jgi:hypothetical protein